MDTNHTPGPWEIDGTGYRTHGNGLCVMAGKDCIAVVGEWNPDQPQFANAKLIAAAPLLLDALRRIVAMWDHHADVHGDGAASPLHEAARAAIAATN